MMTAATKEQVFSYIIKDKLYEDILKKYASRKSVRDELRQHMWLQIGNIKEEKLLDSWNKNYFTYLFVAIIRAQVVTNDSSWHHNFRGFVVEANEENINETTPSAIDEWIAIEESIEKKMKVEWINEALQYLLKINPHYLTQAELFKMYYFQNLSYGQISKKTKIAKVTVFDQVRIAKTLIKTYIKKKYGHNFNS